MKGSIIKRKTHNPKPSSTLKDQNLLEIKIDQNILKFPTNTKDEIVTRLEEAVSILLKGGIMDQSLLLGVEPNTRFELVDTLLPGIYDKTPEEEEFFRNRHRFMSADRKFIYHIAIIDYLQHYNIGKWFEYTTKGIINGSFNADYSCWPPKRYQRRFLNFMKEEVIVDDAL